MKKYFLVVAVLISIIACRENTSNKIVAVVKELSSPTKDSTAEPFLFTDKNGSVYLSWIEKHGKTSSLLFSVFKNESWSTPVTIAAGNNWFVNWADYPVLSSDGTGNMIAHYLEKSDTGKFTYDIKIVSSNDSGKSWSQSKLLNDDQVKAEHGFVSMTSYKDGFFTSWLDGRKTAMETDAGSHNDHHGEMTLRGAALDISNNKTSEWELDSRVCDCCQTSVAITNNGPVVVYRDRSADEIRDISIVRFVDGNWTEPQPIYSDNWSIKGCPVNGPQISAKGNKLAVAWFSMPDKKSQVNIVFSKNGGETFNKPIKIDEGKPIGRVDVVLLDENTAMVSWMEGAAIKAVKVHSDGRKESSLMIASSSDSKSSGFPQMTKSGNQLFFAWTDAKEKNIKISTITF